MDDHPVTIAIVTLDRHAELSRTLEALGKVDLDAVLEILIVDQSEIPFDPGGAGNRLSVPFRVIPAEARGLAFARNRALEQTRSGIVLFIDDDVIPDPQLVSQHLASYRASSRVLGVAGRETIASDRREARSKALARSLIVRLLRPYLRRSGVYRDFLDREGQPVGIITASGLFICNFDRPYPCRVMTPRGCNMSFRTDALRAVAGFDAAFVGPRRDESDLALRLQRRFPEAELVFNPAARVLHRMATTGGCRSVSGRERVANQIRAEVLFAAAHLSRVGRFLLLVRTALRYAAPLVRHPSLVPVLFERGSPAAESVYVESR